MKFSTIAVHSGMDVELAAGASSVPIYQASTFDQPDPDHYGTYGYSRGANPTRVALEQAVAALEGGVRGLAFASGMAAISSTFLLLNTGDHIVVSRDLYGGAYRILGGVFKRWGLRVSFVDTTDPAAVEAAIGPDTRALYVETPSNPLLLISPLAPLAKLAKARGLLAIIDNTFMTPYLQRPLAMGFDISLHSATKFLAGHSDVVAGLAVCADEETGKRLGQIQNAFGAILGPQDSWLTLRGLRTLTPRMEAQQATAWKMARWLEERPEVAKVHYPGLESHPGADIHRSQAAGPGAVLSFELADATATKAFLRAVKLPLFAVSLGGVESILSHPATMSHAAMGPEERARRGVSDGLIRFSVGLEAAEDLQEDLAQALKQAAAR